MDKETLGVLLSFALYGVYFLVPLIPAILIYKIFPDTSVSTSGSLANFKINSSVTFKRLVTFKRFGMGYNG